MGGVQGSDLSSNDEQDRSKSQGQLLVSNIVGYVTNAKPLYTNGCIAVIADGIEICRVTRKQDAFRIMTALKRDYKDIVVCAVL